uniref:Variant surface glycoprotein 1125.4035 n=1 Tax=Trypanosoma brucei TaxID=5691 RepID=A0A1J0RA33_9TRYP|nr:variant surface glycoprotein 1125.4035 [Trypanosoma brucei]
MMNQLTLAVLAAALVFLGATSRVYGAAGDGANDADFHVLCNLVNLAKTPVDTAIPQLNLDDKALDDIREIWVALADPKYTTSLPNKLGAEGAATAETPCQTSPKAAECKSNWTKWQAAKQRTATAGEQAKHKPLSDELRNSVWGKQAAEAVAHLEAKATKDLNDYTNSLKSQITTMRTTLKSQLTDALYGNGQTSFEGTEGATLTVGSNRAAGCEGANVSKSLVGDLLCLCAVDSNQGNAKHCGFVTTSCSSGLWTACTGASAKSAWLKIDGKCGHFTKLEFGPQALTLALAAFSGRLRSDITADADTEAAVYLGNSHTRNCAQTGQAARCVDYSSAFKEGASRQKISWYDKLASAATTIATITEKQAEVQTKQYAIKQLTQEADRIYLSLSTLNIKDIEAHRQPAPAVAALLSSKKAKCSQYHNKSKECTDNGCKWEGATEKDGKCIVDESKVATQTTTGTGAGDGAAGATASTGCKRHGTKAECDADKTGDKQNCAWRKGKEGEDEKDTEKCRNGSFLLNKKSSISTDAALMSLVSFYI